MKKKILGGIAVLAIATIAAFNVSLSSQASLSDISLANVEALAGNESGDSKTDHGCESCTSSQGYAGVRFSCISGSSNCLETGCVSGHCG